MEVSLTQMEFKNIFNEADQKFISGASRVNMEGIRGIYLPDMLAAGNIRISPENKGLKSQASFDRIVAVFFITDVGPWIRGYGGWFVM